MCHEFVPVSHNSLKVCPNPKCRGLISVSGGESLFDDFCRVLYRYKKFLSEDYTKNSLWYHATSVENWEQHTLAKSGFLMHAGSRETAIQRAIQISPRPTKLYTLRLKPCARVDKNIFDDAECFPDSADDLEGVWDGSTVARYVNAYEIPGSISIVAPTDLFYIVHEKDLN